MQCTLPKTEPTCPHQEKELEHKQTVMPTSLSTDGTQGKELALDLDLPSHAGRHSPRMREDHPSALSCYSLLRDSSIIPVLLLNGEKMLLYV